MHALHCLEFLSDAGCVYLFHSGEPLQDTPCLCSPLSLPSPPRGHLRDKGLAQLFVPGSVSENAN